MSVEVTRLPSGLTVVTDSMPHLQTASLGVWVGSGSRDEEPNEHGISHLLEHMAFKGTKRRTARQIAEEIEAVGGDLNAATSVETTAYFARVLKADMPLALDVLSDILSNPTFDPAELKREQNVIVQEIGASEDNARRSGVRAICNRPRFRTSRSAAPILGTRETVRSFKDKQPARLSRRATIAAPDMVVAAAGAVEHARRGRRGRDAASASSTARPAPAPQPATLRRRHASSRPAISSRSISRWRWRACRRRDPDYFSLQVFAIVLGGGMSSRLFQEVREKRGLCYTISAFHAPYADTGMFGLYAGTDAADVERTDAGRGGRDRGRRRRPSPRPRSTAPRRR